MSTSPFILDTLSSDMGMDEFLSTELDTSGTDLSNSPPFSEPGYEGTIDYRIRQLSYSSMLTLHTCPRKFQLYKLRTPNKSPQSLKSTVTFAFGHVVGQAIQDALAGVSEQEIMWKLFLGWHADFYDEDPKLNKSIFQAVIATQRFIQYRNSGALRDYELLSYDNKPACELSFAIDFPDGFRLRGYVDAVLVHKYTGEVLVLELKTTGSAAINPATYKNSAQAIGYSVVLDVLHPDISSYKVLYLIYSTKTGEYAPIEFNKSYLQRALWIRELLLDIETIKMYEDAGVYPMHGESCYNFFRECEYLNTCQLSTSALTKPCKPEEEDKVDYQVKLTLQDLIESQLQKA
jgi:PD-(D/E)XK nuclease superfamily